MSKISTTELKLTIDLNKALVNIGLTEKETKTYLATLELGEAPASKIALRAKLNRVTSYDILERLIKRGFISTYTKGKIKVFSATEPDIIKDKFQEKFEHFNRALPELRRLHGKTSHPRVQYFEGVEGVKIVYKDSLKAKTEILNYADSKLIRDFWPEYDEEYVQERVRHRIYLRGLTPKNDAGQRVIQSNERFHREIRMVPAGPFSFLNEINIYDNKVSIISFGKDEVLAMIIESQEIAHTQRAIFMMAWEFAGMQNQY